MRRILAGFSQVRVMYSELFSFYFIFHRARKLGPLLRLEMAFATNADQSKLSRDRGCTFWANRFSRCL